MSEYLKLFDTHADYENFVDGGTMVKPNVSYCVEQNELHYNPVPYEFTIKQLFEFAYNLNQSFFYKFKVHRNGIFEKYPFLRDWGDYTNICEINFGRLRLKIEEERAVQIRNLELTGNYPSLLINSYKNNNNGIIDLGVYATLEANNEFQYKDATFGVLRFRLSDEWGEYDVFEITYSEIYEYPNGYDDWTEEEQEICRKETFDKLLYGNVVLLIPKNCTTEEIDSRYEIAYKTSDGGYTKERPSDVDLELPDLNFAINPESIHCSLYNQDSETENRVDNAVIDQRGYYIDVIRGNFSKLSVLDDIKITLPYEQADVIRNPWKYFNEDYIFDPTSH